ncbi:MAG TPA: DNA mismatch repair endonuclease MutL [Chthonomonadales bacterium]|nr:DNA mismatch repair endonuclease MutL [Chthonomonadales bacterium]
MTITQRMNIPRTPIQPLSQDVAERIAAGEVIERPVSVVKELVENALDAGSREIRVEIRGGGLSLVRVSDDGIGVPASELEQALARHTTSKIRNVEDLHSLYTLGFRGEALASIAAVSEVMLVSRALESEERGEESPAVSLTMRGGEVTQRGHAARLHGTTVTVRDLFYNVPARLKFMRSERTEAAHIILLARRYAVGYPEVRFTLAQDEYILVQTSGSGDLATTLAELYHLPLAEMLHPLIMEAVGKEQDFRLSGYVGNRALAQSSRQHVSIFVNGRWVQSRSLLEALEAGYRNLLPKGKHPLIVLHLTLPPEELDVNVHPAKTEVKLLREAEVKKVVADAVRSAMGRSPALPEQVDFPGPELVFQRHLPGPHRKGLRLAESAEGYKATEQVQVNPVSSAMLAQLQPLAQLQQAVILAEAPDGSLYLIDQHRAHERVIYEHLRQTYAGRKAEQPRQDEQDEEWSGAEGAAGTHGTRLLLEPVVVELKPHEAEMLELRLPMLRGMGLECERFGGRSFLIRSVPVGIDLGQEPLEQVASHLPELARLAAEDSSEWQDRLLVGLACRSALRRGRTLGRDEQRALIHALAIVAAPAVCPHGSPIVLHYSRKFLVDRFDW